MRTDTLKLLEEINNSLDLLKEKNKRDDLEQKLNDLNTKIEDPKLWDDQLAATAIMKERQSIIERMETFERLRSAVEDNTELIELGEEEDDEEIVLEAEKSISDLHVEIEKIVVEALLDDEADKNDAFLEIKAGAGGTESCRLGPDVIKNV